VKENGMAKLLHDENELIVEGYNGGLAFYKDVRSYGERLELMKINDNASRITLSDFQKLNGLRSIHFKGCDDIFSAELDDGVVLHSVQDLHIEKLQIDGELFSRVLRCFPAVSKLTITKCKNLELMPLEDGGLSNLVMLQSFKGFNCGKLFSRWLMGEVGGSAHGVKPFPTSLRELYIFLEASMQSMGLLSNLTSLTRLQLACCEEVTMDGFNPLIIVNLKKLYVNTRYTNEKGISIAGDLFSEIARSKVMHAGSFQLEELHIDSISAVLTAPICSHLAATLYRLEFSHDNRERIFTEEQEHSLHLLTSLQNMEFRNCDNLQSLPQGLRVLSSLKQLMIYSCEKILSLPPKEGFPTSLERLDVSFCSPEVTKQAEKLKGADAWFGVKILPGST
jgi:hypothetical protein